MNFRRSDFDVTNRINTTDPVCVKLEVARIYRTLYSRDAGRRPCISAFDDIVRLYRGEFPGYARCDTEYHDLQHILEVTLAMARLLDGYERSRGDGPAIGERLFQLGRDLRAVPRLRLHPQAPTTRSTTTAPSTRRRTSRAARKFLQGVPADDRHGAISPTSRARSCTSPATSARSTTIRVPDPIYKLLGSLLGSADIIAQMSDRCYLEKCRDRLYPEFVAGGITRKKTTDNGEVVVFASADDLLRKTPSFYQNATRRLDEDLGGAYQYAQTHFGGTQPLHGRGAAEHPLRRAHRRSRDRAAPPCRRRTCGAASTILSSPSRRSPAPPSPSDPAPPACSAPNSSACRSRRPRPPRT